LHVKVSAESDIPGLVIIDAERQPLTHQRRGTTFTVFLKAPGYNITQAVTPVRFRVEAIEDPTVFAEYSSKFNAPAR
jgi:hypothetical protein